LRERGRERERGKYQCSKGVLEGLLHVLTLASRAPAVSVVAPETHRERESERKRKGKRDRERESCGSETQK